ncbi:Anp1-domain-containing protein [Lipomyces arxii]|uniref:Anp1-domain-containing protein n=1 Tax=Lipomyces arxii TaxID=56418 RepID=UPI0034CEE96F
MRWVIHNKKSDDRLSRYNNYTINGKYTRSPLSRITRTLITSGLFLLVVLYLLLRKASPKRITFPADANVSFYDLSDSRSTPDAIDRDEHVLVCIPLRDATPYIPMMLSHLVNLTYPHALIDIAFLISDSADNTLTVLLDALARLQTSEDAYQRFREITIVEKDFGQIVGQGFTDRHGFAAQGPRRKLMGRARNWLLTSALKKDHSWVYWRDADILSSPTTIIEDLMSHDRDVIVPNVWRPLPEYLGGEQPYDLNSWQESEAALELAKQLPEDAVIVEGYAEYATWRPHLAYAREVDGNSQDLVDLDGVGGVSILAKATVFRAGAMFPGFAFQNHAETEGFGKLCRAMHFTVSGLPHYVVWHVFEPSADDMEAEKEKKDEARKAAAANAAKKRRPRRPRRQKKLFGEGKKEEQKDELDKIRIPQVIDVVDVSEEILLEAEADEV